MNITQSIPARTDSHTLTTRVKALALAALLFTLSCTNKAGRQHTAEEPPVFIHPEVPAILTNPDDKAAYVVNHFWDRYDFSDTAHLRFPKVTEQALADYINMLDYVQPQTSEKAIKELLTKAETNDGILLLFLDMFEKYLYDPNSPYRSEELYIPVLEHIVASDKISETDKTRPRYRLGMAMKNRVGTIASDFTFYEVSGRKSSLHAIKTPYLLVYFHNPDCSTCKETMEMIKNSQVITRSMQQGSLKLLAMYIDEDIDLWRKHNHEIPASWINAYDPDQYLKNNEMYDFKAIPTFYLLGQNKEVVLKDPTFQFVEYFFSQ